tara:strand:- start:152 stop:253 length:102 start_codon:yes stop_codon:yes gene_type:complete
LLLVVVLAVAVDHSIAQEQMEVMERVGQRYLEV